MLTLFINVLANYCTMRRPRTKDHGLRLATASQAGCSSIVNVEGKVTLLRCGSPPHPPSYLGHPLPQGGEGSVNLNSCPRPLGGEGGERREPGEGVSNLFKFVYISLNEARTFRARPKQGEGSATAPTGRGVTLKVGHYPK